MFDTIIVLKKMGGFQMASSFVTKSVERQHLKSARKYSLQVIDINTALTNIHNQISTKVDHSKYEAVTEYVNQYVVHTNIWKIKFVSNLENPEVVLMQIFHLNYILLHEPADQFISERAIIENQWLKFKGITLYSDEHIRLRERKMLNFIAQYKKESTV